MLKREKSRGFTLIELMIVVVIIGILAAMAIPRFMAASTKSKQSEARQLLKQIFTMQEAYHVENNTYWGAGVTADAANPNAFSTLLGVEIMPAARYTYTIVTADASDLLIRAICDNLDDDPTQDVWEINQDGNLVCITDDAAL